MTQWRLGGIHNDSSTGGVGQKPSVDSLLWNDSLLQKYREKANSVYDVSLMNHLEISNVCRSESKDDCYACIVEVEEEEEVEVYY